MSKEKTEPYAKEQMLLDLNSAELESASETQLKETIDALKSRYSEARKVRLNTQKEWIQIYSDVRKETVRLHSAVKNGTIEPLPAVQNLKSFVENHEYKEESAE